MKFWLCQQILTYLHTWATVYGVDIDVDGHLAPRECDRGGLPVHHSQHDWGPGEGGRVRSAVEDDVRVLRVLHL